MKPRLAYRRDIDGLRAVAVLAVLAYHAFPGTLPGGFVGVDIFFVISGFLISSILYEEFSQGNGWLILAAFYGRRVRRIFPALLVVLLACYGLGLWLLLPAELTRFSTHLLGAAGFCVNLLFARESGYFNDTSANNSLLHLWSLGIEEQFYLVWPLAVWIAARCRRQFLPLAAFVGMLSFAWTTHRDPAEAGAFFLPQMRLWELLAGAAAAALPLLPSAGKWPARALSWVGLGAIAASLAVLNGGMKLPSAWSLLPTLGTAALICAGSDSWFNRRVLSLPVLVGVGLISYPLYLWHWPLLVFSRLALDQPDSAWAKAAVLAVSLGLAFATYRWIERPLRRQRPGRCVPPLLAGMAVIAALGFAARRWGGFPSRFPPLIQRLATFSYQPSVYERPGYFLFDGEDETDFVRSPADSIGNKPTLYLWGDSHAAALYPGLEAAFGGKYNIVERTAANLPPFAPTDHSISATFPGVNRFVLESIRREKPACVVLGGNWPSYDWKEVRRTIAAVHAAGVAHIVLVGPLPQWNGSLPQQLCNFARRHPEEPVPTRLDTGFRLQPLQIDLQMAALAAQAGAEYVSPCHLLRAGSGFLVRLGDTPDSLIAFDYGHLTTEGSRYLVSKFPPL